MELVLRGLHFQTKSGASYYYDDCSGLVFPCPGELKELLENLDNAAIRRLFESPYNELSQWESFIRERYNSYGAFFVKMDPSIKHVNPTPEQFKQTITTNGFRQLILTITGVCNMSCRYCINSEAYPFADKLSFQFMPYPVAKKAVDYYLKHIKMIKKNDPGRKPVITFYGGEPLLNFKVIQEIVEYIKKKNEEVFYTISTNGLLLDDITADFLIDNNFAIWVSLDGPQKQHDKNRVFSNGQGSFQQVYSNIEKIWKRHPEYKLLNYLVTYDWGTDFDELREFFNSRKNFRQALFMFNPVSSSFTEYYSRFSQEERERFIQTAVGLKKKLSASDNKEDPVMNFFCAAPYRLHLMRRIMGAPGRTEIPATSCCLPGEKICVLPDGRIQPCERVPGLADIGTVERGLDFEAIAGLIERYNTEITVYCIDCPVQMLCRSCFSHFWSGEQFRKNTATFCQDQLASTKELLKETYGLLEENPVIYEEVTRIYQQRYSHLLSLHF